VKVIERIRENVDGIEAEYAVLNSLRHPNLPRFHGLFLKRWPKHSENLWLVMEVFISEFLNFAIIK